jgi:vancomycin resistance protein YoaR
LSDEITQAPPWGGSQPSPTHGHPFPTRVLLIAAGLLGVAYLGLILLNGGDVARGATVLGVPIGGLDRAAAVERLQSELGARAAAPIPVLVDGAPQSVDPAVGGLTFDAAATVDAVDGRTFNPVTLVTRLFGSSETPPVIAVDEAKLAAAVAALAATTDRPLTEGGVVFKGAKATPVAPVTGLALDQAGSAKALKAGYLVETEPLALPAATQQPTVTEAEVQRALAEFAVPAVSAEVVVAVGGRQIPAAPAKITPALTLVPVDGTLTPAIDAAVLKESLAPVLAPVETAPKDASFVLQGGQPTVVPSVVGASVPPQGLADAVLAVLPNPEGNRVAAVTLEERQPKLTTEQARSLGVKELVSTFTTKYPYAAYRLQNIHRAADLIDGTVLLPGETFSMNTIVGERTAANGFAEGIIINNGKFEKDFGGGVSQVATTTYNAAFFAGLKDVQHKAHSFYISRYPAGREATVAWPTVDLKFQNDTPYGVLVDTSYTNSTVTVSIWGTKVYDIEAIAGPRTDPKPFQTEYSTGEGCVPQDGVEGFKIVVTRVFKQGGVEVKREDIKTSYNAANQIYCRAAPAPTPAPAPVAPAPAAPVAPPATTPPAAPAPA